MPTVDPLTADQLYQECDVDQFTFETTEDLESLREIIGQPRAVQAVQFGVGMAQSGYNIFAMGSPGSGKQTLVEKFFNEAAAERPVPGDWVYVYNFQQSHQPYALQLEPGEGLQLKQDMEQLVQNLKAVLSSTFEGDEYRSQLQEIQEDLNRRQETALKEIDQAAEQRGLSLMRTPAGLGFAPVKDGEAISPEEFEKLPEEEQEKIQQDIEELKSKLQEVVQQQPRLEREMRERAEALNRQVAGRAIDDLIDELREKYSHHDRVVEYLDAVEQDVLDNVERFMSTGDDEGESQLPAFMQAMVEQREDAFMDRYAINVIVNNSDTEGAPVIYENSPTYQNLIGRVEHMPQMGALTTNFTLIKSGALHRANGGYLILEARKLLLQPYAWEGLKRVLETSCIRIESPREIAGLISTVSLEPEPIDLDVKIALLGERRLFYLLQALEPDFPELFKVVADFDEVVDRDDENQELYARLIGSLARKEGLRPLDRQAVARVIEHSARLASDAYRLTTQVRSIADLLAEADYWAGEDGNGVIRREDVQTAIDAQIYRQDRVRQRIQESIQQETIYIDTTGEQVGQINALSVLQLGGFAFGRPSRITARMRLGEGEVVDIEREAELGGPLHAKGMMIITGFLGAKYAPDFPLSLSATLVFEQSYGGIDGDSASSTELYALLSAISGASLKQSLAVTGSVNQYGQVQPIGGVNEKIEGFFDICQQRGLTGDQGVLIPAANIRHLMLREDVRAAVAAGDFHIYPIETIDQGITLLTGLEAGEADDDGAFPPDTVNGRVQARLRQMAETRSEWARKGDQSDH